MKKWLIVILVIIIFLKVMETSPQDTIDFYEEKWGIELPLPDEINDVHSSEPSFNGDGEWFTIFTYTKDNVEIEKSGMVPIAAANIGNANYKIEKFIATTLEIYMDEETTELKKKFDQYPVKAELGDYYFYKAKNGGNDYFIAVYKQHEQKLYIFEWHQ